MSKTPYQYINLVGKNLQSGIDKKINRYSNITEMKSDSTLQVGDFCVTFGYYTPNDNGGGEYEIIAADATDKYVTTLVADGGYIHDLDNGLKARLVLKSNVVQIEQFGAKGYYYGECYNKLVSELHDSTSAFKNAASFCLANATHRNAMQIELAGKRYFAHEVDMLRAVMIKGKGTLSSRIVYNGKGGDGSYIFKVTGGSGSSCGAFQMLALDGCHVSSDAQAADYGFIEPVMIDFGCSFEYVHFLCFMKGGIKANPLNMHMTHMRFDCCNEFAIELIGNACSFTLRDFTIDYKIRLNDRYLSLVSAKNGSSDLCGYGLLSVCKDDDSVNISGSYLIENARIEGQTWLRPYNGKYSHVVVNSTKTPHGVFRFTNLEGGQSYNSYTNRTKSMNLIRFLRYSAGVIVEGCVDAYFTNTVLYNMDVENYRNVYQNRCSHMKKLEYYSSNTKDGGPANKWGQGILLDGKSIGVSFNREYNYDYYKYGDILFRAKDPTDLLSYENKKSLGWICTYPVKGCGLHAESSTAKTISTTANENTLSGEYLVGCSYTISYSGGTTQVVVCNDFNATTKVSTFDTTFTSTDSNASIAETLCEWTEFGKIGEPDVLISPNGTKYKLKVANDGTLSTTAQS